MVNGLLVYSISEATRTDKQQNGVLPCLKFGINSSLCAGTTIAAPFISWPQRDSLRADLDKNVTFRHAQSEQ
jgi:hypothetical protein